MRGHKCEMEEELAAIPDEAVAENLYANEKDLRRYSRKNIPCLPEAGVLDEEEYVPRNVDLQDPKVKSHSVSSLNTQPIEWPRQTSSVAGYIAKGVKGLTAVTMALAKGFHSVPGSMESGMSDGSTRSQAQIQV